MGSYAYQVIVDDLVSKISSGVYPIGSKLPTIESFCDEFDVSKITVRRAMDDLASMGLISRQRGSGTFVKSRPMGRSDRKLGWNLSNEMHGFATECVIRGMVPKEVVNSFTQIVPSSEVAQALALAPRERCHRMDRTLLADDVVCMVEVSYIPVQLAPDLTARDGEQSLFAYLQRTSGQRIASSYRRLKAALPSEELALRLGVSTDEPVLQFHQTSYLENGRPIEDSVALHAPGYEFYTVTQMCS